MTQTEQHSKKQLSLGVLLLRLVFSIYLFVTVIVTSAQMYSDYRLEKHSIQSTLSSYQEIYGESVATALWNLDTEQLKATLDGASELQEIAGILLYDSDGFTLYHSGVAPKTAEDNALESKRESELFSEALNISFSEKEIGTLYLYSSNRIVFDNVKYNFLFILINALIKTAALWVLFLWAFKKYLVGALDEFIAKMKATDLDNLDQADLEESSSRLLNSRELSFLDQVFGSLRRRLKHSKQELDDINASLEETVNKRTELLQRQQRVMESMSQQAHIGAWEYDVESETTFWSDTTRQIFGVDKYFEPSQRATLSFFSEAEAAKLGELERKAIQEGTPWEEELIITTAQGKEVWVASTGEAEIRDGRCVRLFGSFQDIDQRVRTAAELKTAKDKAEEADELKTGFLTSLSHEIRTPMNGIVGMLNVLLSNDLSHEQAEQVRVSLKSAESLMALLDDLLDISKIESGHFELELVDFDLRQLFDDQVSLWRTKADQKGIRIDLDLHDLYTNVVNGDPHRIQQITSNLLSNAIKFSSDGTITVATSLEPHESYDVLTIAVSDQGCGIPEPKQRIIYDSFARADFQRTGELGGAGLGLTIVKELTKMMDGSITLESKEGEGSTFTVRLEVGHAKDQAPASTSETLAHVEAPSSDSPLGEYKVLVVEDNPVNQMVAVAMLEQQGLNCDVAADGVLAIERLNDDKKTSYYAMILMDCLMPRMDGYETTHQIRSGKAGERYRNIPIVAMTANAMKGDKEKCLKAGMDDYLAKPVTPESLKQILDQWYQPVVTQDEDETGR